MTMTVQAIYQGGVLRPETPLALAEGAAVEITITTVPATMAVSEDEMIRRIQSCKTYSEWLALMKSLPGDDGGYDIVKALDENRRWSGERPLLPAEGV